VTFNGKLFDFQAQAVERMLDRKCLLLAHDLGLGKTISSIAAVESLIDTGKASSVLVVCPASIKWQWKHQIDKFTDGALVTVIEGTKGERRAQYRSVRRGDWEYVIANYEQIVADWDIVHFLPFDVVVCDEVVAIKNPGSKRSRHIKRLEATYRFGLSGQPIENRPEELFSVMEFIDPSVLGRFDIFDRTFIVRNAFGAPKRYRNLHLLRERMSEAMDRRTRHEVRDQMPAVVEKSYLVEFDPASRKLYRTIVRELVATIHASPKINSFNLLNHYAGVDDNRAVGEVMARLMALRMLCDHPALLSYSADQFDDPDTKAGSSYAASLQQSGVLQPLKAGPKLAVAVDLIHEVLDADPANKIVVFSFFKPMLAIMQSTVKSPSAMFTGDQTPKERDVALQHFTNDPFCRVLFSSDAGGIGVDIPVANYLLSYDLPWSAGKFAQRNGRIVRISSKWPEVTLLSLLMRGSIEERMWDMLQAKSAIAAAWLDGRGVDQRGNFELTLGTLETFLQEKL